MLGNRLCVLTLFVIFNYGYGLDEGELCTLNKGTTGRCRALGQCPAAIADLQKNILPTTCSFQGSVPIVCCSESAAPVTTPSTTTKRTTTRSTTKRTTTTPTTTTTATTTTTTTTAATTTAGSSGEPLPVGEMSKQKCREYATHVFQLYRPPIFVPTLVNRSVCGIVSVPLIVGGTKAKPMEFPHQALLGFGEDDAKSWQCGGTLISEEFVLTAAHCVRNSELGNVKYIRLGDLNFLLNNDNAKPQDFDVAEIIRHPEWKPPFQYNDIALLKMDRPVTFDAYIRPACLHTTFTIEPTRNDSNIPRYIATGWGRTEFGGDVSADLLKVVLDNFNQNQCSLAYSTTTKRKLPNGIREDSQLCAGGSDAEKDTCQGDSGGPLQIYHKDVYCMYKLVGVTSFGKTCGVTGVPGVYTRVSSYIEWIEKIIWPQT